MRVCASSQVIRLSVEGDVVQVHVDVCVVLVAHPADGRAVKRGPQADVGLQAGQRLRLLHGDVELWEFKGQQLGTLVVAAERERRPADSEKRSDAAWSDEETSGRPPLLPQEGKNLNFLKCLLPSALFFQLVKYSTFYVLVYVSGS